MRVPQHLPLVEGHQQVLYVAGGQVILVLVGRKEGQRVDRGGGGGEHGGAVGNQALRGWVSGAAAL